MKRLAGSEVDFTEYFSATALDKLNPLKWFRELEEEKKKTSFHNSS